MSEELRYPLTPGQIMGDEPATLPPPYEEAIKPGASQARGEISHSDIRMSMGKIEVVWVAVMGVSKYYYDGFIN